MTPTQNMGPGALARRMSEGELEAVTRATVSGVMRVMPRLIAQAMQAATAPHEKQLQELGARFDRLADESQKAQAALRDDVATLRTDAADLLDEVLRADRKRNEQHAAIIAETANRAQVAELAASVEQIRQHVAGELGAFDAAAKEAARVTSDRFADLGAQVEDAKQGAAASITQEAAGFRAELSALAEKVSGELDAFGAAMRAASEEVAARLVTMGEHVQATQGAAAGAVEEITRAQVEHMANVKAAVASALTDYESQLRELRANVDGLAKSVVDAVLVDVDGRASELRAELRALVAAIPAGEKGDKGDPGEKGRDGRDGYDATFTQPVPYAAGRMFARGAVVQHLGALWYANTDTDREPGAPMSGFSLIVDGVRPSGVEADDAGFLHLRIAYASGRSELLPLNYRPMQYRGIWDESRTYLPNDCLTCDGGLFIAKRETTGARPGTDAGGAYWQLIVKRGKDGRNGTDGKDGAAGRSFKFRGKYNAKADYYPDDVVLVAESLHICTKYAPAKDRPRAYSPTIAPDDWALFLPSLIVDKSR